MNREQELLIGSIVLLLLGVWFTHTGYFDRPKEGESAPTMYSVAKAQILGPGCLLLFLYLLFKLLFGE